MSKCITVQIGKIAEVVDWVLVSQKGTSSYYMLIRSRIIIGYRIQFCFNEVLISTKALLGDMIEFMAHVEITLKESRHL